MLDNYYISVFKYYKKSIGKRSIALALVYINLLELSLILVICTFFMAFAKQMKIITMTSQKFWILFSMVSLFIVFKNWMRYNGKKRNVLNAKTKAKRTSIYLLWLLPLGYLIISFVLFQVV
ncbi:hypothetical protein [Winogradskyella sp. PE311]|uniref:hypothetical protein n=1 Tax=Winogradskyella sp. PE311 TaxID=3366943 RepID=UPI0039814A7B